MVTKRRVRSLRVRRPPATRTVHQLKITLKDSKPPIWRRVQVASDISLAKLHAVIQVAMGWSNSHLHQFIVGETYYGQPDPEWDWEVKSERTGRLSQVAPAPKDRFTYEYDFGDGWEHEVLVEEVLPAKAGMRYPVCLAGKRACPPGDCGGIWGYAEFLKAIRDRTHPDHEEMLDWIGGEFEPEAFDLPAVNRELREIMRPARYDQER